MFLYLTDNQIITIILFFDKSIGNFGDFVKNSTVLLMFFKEESVFFA
jgi:hypothetical protein